MNITIKYFGRITDITKCEEEMISINQGTILSNAELILKKKYPLIEKELYTLFINNKRAINTDQFLNNNDEICIMPPFSGG